jgi:two-component system response regulator AtoC
LAVELPPGDLSVKRAQRTLERELILRALAQTQGNRTQAAKLLELSHRALLYKIKEFGLG